MMKPLMIEFCSRPDLLIRAVRAYREWLEAKLGVPLEQCVLLEVDTDMAQIGLENILGLSPCTSGRLCRLSMMVAGAEIPPGSLPIVEVTKAVLTSSQRSRNLAQILAGHQNAMLANNLKWAGCPVLLMLDGGRKPMAALRVNWKQKSGATADESANLLVVDRQYIEEAIRIVEFTE